MLKSIRLKFSEAPTTLDIQTGGITIFVGPNNSGKSLVSAEKRNPLLLAMAPLADAKILNDFEIDWPSTESLELEIAQLEARRPPGLTANHIQVGRLVPTEARIPQRWISTPCAALPLQNKINIGWPLSFFVLDFSASTEERVLHLRKTGPWVIRLHHLRTRWLICL